MNDASPQKRFISNRMLLFILLGISISLNIFFFVSDRIIADSSKQARFPFLSKRIYIQDQNDFLLNFQPLREAVNKYISRNEAEKIEYYFEYLPSGMSIGVNERKQFPAGSLGKVPIVLAVYKKIETGKIKENDLVTLSDKDKDKEFGDFWQKPTGTKITVEEAVRRTLTYSDNTTFRMLHSLLNEKDVLDAYNMMDISFVEVEGKSRPYISAKSNSSALKALFLSVYLKQEYSSKLLSFMSESPFNDGLTKYMEPGVKVSHKIGVASFLGTPTSSDCGIVYIPNRPYLLCIMVQGDRDTSLNHIAYLSKITDEYVRDAK